ncbi:MAG: hypothetical protein EGQ20_12895 [Bacteroides oleiciplenus]|nr:hypothetical protein [Bacteroides oleiciplenus]
MNYLFFNACENTTLFSEVWEKYGISDVYWNAECTLEMILEEAKITSIPLICMSDNLQLAGQLVAEKKEMTLIIIGSQLRDIVVPTGMYIYYALDYYFAVLLIRGLNNRYKYIYRSMLKDLACSLKKEHTIVTLNGCFDVLHPGHLKIICEAKAQGDILIVGINADKYIRCTKGKNRPFNSSFLRSCALCGLSEVDYIFVFEEDSPIDFIYDISPDIHVNGAEYGTNCIESEAVTKCGGILHLVERDERYSTTVLFHS